MNKNLLQELILPSFWLFFFIVAPGRDTKVNSIKNSETAAIKKQGSFSTLENLSTSENIKKNKEATLIKAVYLSGF